MQENSDSQEKKETKKTQGNFFEAPGVLKSDFKGESGIKPEGKIEEKETSIGPEFQERKEPKESRFQSSRGA